MIENPILRGFNPDPSICRVGGDYYIATSTFEWYPGVQIHQSTDLVNWTLISRPLRRPAQLDMRGNPDSCGVWAPCLSHDGQRFWLVYTDVKRFDGAFKDAHNYIVTADRIDGDWSDPTYVTSSGFDPSLFHDDDGRKWFLNMRWNHRGRGTGLNPAHDAFDGIELQEWHPDHGLVGDVTTIFAGSSLGLTEAPHLFKKNGWYYLTVAEGGTGYDHAVTMARSKAITGPYDMHPDIHLLTARFTPDHLLQRVGHGQYVETPDGQGLHTFLCGRPLPGQFCPLGRETGIARIDWHADGWPRLAGSGMAPPVTVDMPAQRRPDLPIHRHFQTRDLPPEFQWLRTPYPERLFTLTGQSLRLTGRESLGSFFEQSLIARRQEHLAYSAATTVLADPPNWQRAAGLVTYYNRHKFHAALVTHDPAFGRCLSLVSCLGDWPGEGLTHHGLYRLPDGPVRIAVQVIGPTQRFRMAIGDAPLADIGPDLDARIISDEGGRGEHASFTGAFVGMAAMDLTGQGWSADFLHFDYIPAP